MEFYNYKIISRFIPLLKGGSQDKIAAFLLRISLSWLLTLTTKKWSIKPKLVKVFFPKLVKL